MLLYLKLAGKETWSIFFFSSRRRHTRSLCDWSSDVCSSDLVGPPVVGDRARRADDQQEDEQPLLIEEAAEQLSARGQERRLLEVGGQVDLHHAADERQPGQEQRSEERRVGKEWRSRWAPAQ